MRKATGTPKTADTSLPTAAQFAALCLLADQLAASKLLEDFSSGLQNVCKKISLQRIAVYRYDTVSRRLSAEFCGSDAGVEQASASLTQLRDSLEWDESLITPSQALLKRLDLFQSPLDITANSRVIMVPAATDQPALLGLVLLQAVQLPCDNIAKSLAGIVAHAAHNCIHYIQKQLAIQNIHVALEESDTIYGTWHHKSGWSYHNINGFLRMGYKREEVDITSFEKSNPMHPDDLKGVIPLFLNCLETGTDYEYEYRAVGNDGSEQWFHTKSHAAIMQNNGKAALVTSVSRNVTDIKSAIRALEQSSQEEIWLVNIAKSIFSCTSFQAFDAILQEFSVHLNLARCSLRLVDPATLDCNLISEWTRDDLVPLKIKFPDLIRQTGVGWIEAFIKLGDSNVINDTAAEESSRKMRTYYKAIDCDAIVSTPMLFENKLVGFVAVIDSRPRQWNKSELRSVKIVTDCLHMAVERLRLLDELRASDERFRLAMENSSFGMWDYDPATGSIYLSPHYFTTLGYVEGELEMSMQTIFDLTHPEDKRFIDKNPLRQFSKGKDAVQLEFRQRRKDGNYIWILSRGRVVKRDGAGKPTRIMGVNMDMTELKKNITELKKIRESAEDANHSKSEFLERMSHEIRTPMNAILGMSYLTLDTGLHPTQRSHIEDIESAAKSLLHIIDDILDFSKIESGELKIVASQFNLRDELNRIIKLFSLRANQNSNELLCNIADDVPELVTGDQNRLGQVLTNLLSNAIKFTHNGTVSLAAQCADFDPRTQSASILFSVSDSGIGLTTEQIARLFQPYEQAENSTTRKFGGTGLGLSICKHLVEMMGGSIHAISLPTVGTTFHFTIVFKNAVWATANKEAAPINSSALQALSRATHFQHRRVLLVEDNLVNQRVAQGMLKKLGVKYVTANNGQEALYILKVSEPREFDAILMDIEMPILNGIDTTRAIRCETRWNNTPIIAMTAHAMIGDRERCETAGMNDYIPKPVNPTKLVKALEKIWPAERVH